MTRTPQPLLLKYLLSLGVHIGHTLDDYQTHKQLINPWLCGVRKKVLVIDLKRTSFLLKRALLFLYTLNTNISFNFFGFSKIHEYDFPIRNLLHRMVTNNQLLNVFMDLPWTSGLATNFRYCFLRFLTRFCADFVRLRRKSRRTKRNSLNHIFSPSVFKFLWFKMVYIFNEKLVELAIWNRYASRLKSLVKALVFFRTYKHVYRKPDVFCVASPSINTTPILDFKNANIPSVGLVDTNSSPFNLTYPIPSNDDSILIVIFFFKLFCNVIKVGNASYYRSNLSV